MLRQDDVVIVNADPIFAFQVVLEIENGYLRFIALSVFTLLLEAFFSILGIVLFEVIWVEFQTTIQPFLATF